MIKNKIQCDKKEACEATVKSFKSHKKMHMHTVPSPK